MKHQACLVVRKGEPFLSYEVIPLSQENTVIGRHGSQGEPDIAFHNAFVSRQHASVFKRNNQYYIADLGSKHGTEVQGIELSPHVPVQLSESDSILLAKGMVELEFTHVVPDFTLEFEAILSPEIPKVMPSSVDHFVLDVDRQFCMVLGQEVSLSVKEWALLDLLYQHRTMFVSNKDIMCHVWPERHTNGVYDVGLDEINSLVYRIRKKLKQQANIRTVRGSGYVLEENSAL
ncbi:winged helix-turn-helix domain-containing protein [Paenibacillus sp. ACRRX]|uniref:FHA domain-containing protein n=1 Tax=Paenibacillus sp. ACRRX TaxID=2918206 RepID=UPI001EF707EC|nr:FHA domain-containing protein [Paenibacillus sp. ACRRX]MCG7410486.1 winged helix-turn-helix domain-containing protein [Paenibacillus sp. ACRRX]